MARNITYETLSDVARQVALHAQIWYDNDEPFPSQALLAWLDILIDLLGRERIDADARGHLTQPKKRANRR